VGGALAASLAVAAGAVLTATRGPSASPVRALPAGLARQLGPAPVTVALHGSVLALLSSPGIDRLAALESEIEHNRYVRAEYGPVAWLRSRLAAIRRAIAARSSTRVTPADLLVRYGATGPVSIDNQGLATTFVFGAGIQPLPSLRWLFPDADQARIFVRTAGGESASELAVALRRMVQRSGLGGVPAAVGARP
jgi:hypothetical protein